MKHRSKKEKNDHEEITHYEREHRVEKEMKKRKVHSKKEQWGNHGIEGIRLGAKKNARYITTKRKNWRDRWP